MSVTTTAHSSAPAYPGLFGIMAEYDNEVDVVTAARKLYELGYRKMDGYTPFPVHGLDDAIGRRPSRLPFMVLAGGIAGLVGGLSMQIFSTFHYPLNIAGRPFIPWPMFLPITFECTILLASLTAVFAMIGLNGLPQPYHPTFNVPAFVRASANSFFLCIETNDPMFDPAKIRQDMEQTGARGVYDVPE